MLYESDISSLLSQWQKELKESKDPSYKDGLRDCIYDLRMLIDEHFKEEVLAQEAWESQMAEDYLATIEAHDLFYA